MVAARPTPHLVEKLRYIHDRRLTVVPCAIHSEQGKVPFYTGNFDTMNSLSKDWLENVAGEAIGGEVPKLTETVNVEAVTLDSLIAIFGRPDFLKIDVEGHEWHALKGLSEAPQALAFEFHSEVIDTALGCLRQPCFPSAARFNYILGEPYGAVSFVLPEWVTSAEMQSALRELRDIWAYLREVVKQFS